MASNNGGCSGCFGRTGLVLCGKPDKMVAANPVVHSVLSDTMLSDVAPTNVPGFVRPLRISADGLSRKILYDRRSDDGGNPWLKTLLRPNTLADTTGATVVLHAMG
jgi:hypothetical protein